MFDTERKLTEELDLVNRLLGDQKVEMADLKINNKKLSDDLDFITSNNEQEVMLRL